MAEVVNFMGMHPQHTDGRHWTPHRCPHMDRGNIYVDVRDGRVVGAACGACGSSAFVVLVEGKDGFWPVPRDHVIGLEESGGR